MQLKPRYIENLLTFHSFTTQFLSPRVGKWPFPLRAPVSTVANSKSQNARGCPPARPRLSIRAFDKVPPAKQGGLAGLRLRAERAHAGAAGKRADHARKRSCLFPLIKSRSHT